MSELPFSEGYIDHNCILKKGFKIAHVNIQCLRNKVDQLKVFLHINDFDILCLSETWLNSNIDDKEVLIEGYDVCRLDRHNSQACGGVLCYIKCGIMFKEISDLRDNDVEALWIQINLPHTKPILLGTVYRPPNAKAEYLCKLDSIFQSCTALYQDVVILGDFNLDIAKKCNSSKINKISKNNNLHQLINEFTRIIKDHIMCCKLFDCKHQLINEFTRIIFAE